MRCRRVFPVDLQLRQPRKPSLSRNLVHLNSSLPSAEHDASRPAIAAPGQSLAANGLCLPTKNSIAPAIRSHLSRQPPDQLAHSRRRFGMLSHGFRPKPDSLTPHDAARSTNLRPIILVKNHVRFDTAIAKNTDAFVVFREVSSDHPTALATGCSSCGNGGLSAVASGVLPDNGLQDTDLITPPPKPWRAIGDSSPIRCYVVQTHPPESHLTALFGFPAPPGSPQLATETTLANDNQIR